MSLSYGLWAMSNFDNQNFGICGKTIGSLRRNVITSWKLQMSCRGYQVTDKRADNLIILKKGEKSNYFYLFGGKDESSQDLIQGVTLAGVLFDEVALMPKSFVEQAVGRCSVEGSKFWFNCNPSNPYHWFLTDWINRIPGQDPEAVFDDEHLPKKLIYITFTMDDNPSLSLKVKARYKSMFTGIFYQRFILGKWSAADGLVYPMFSEEKHVYKDNVDTLNTRYYVAVDFGLSNPTTFLGIADDGYKTFVEKEYYHANKDNEEKDIVKLGDDFDEFIKGWGHKPRSVIVDPSAKAMILELKKRKYKVTLGNNDVDEGIQLVTVLLSLEVLKINKACLNTCKEFQSYVWDVKAKERGMEKVEKKNDHCLDALRYFVNTKLKKRRFIC